MTFQIQVQPLTGPVMMFDVTATTTTTTLLDLFYQRLPNIFMSQERMRLEYEGHPLEALVY